MTKISTTGVDCHDNYHYGMSMKNARQNSLPAVAFILSQSFHDLPALGSEEQKARKAQADRIREGFERPAQIDALRDQLEALSDDALKTACAAVGLNVAEHSRDGLVWFGARYVLAKKVEETGHVG